MLAMNEAEIPCQNYQPISDRDIPTDPDGARVCECGWGYRMHEAIRDR